MLRQSRKQPEQKWKFLSLVIWLWPSLSTLATWGLGVGADTRIGLPDRNLLNSAFLAIIIASGVTCPVVDVAKVRPVVLATDLVLGRDKRDRRYIEAYRQPMFEGQRAVDSYWLLYIITHNNKAGC